MTNQTRTIIQYEDIEQGDLIEILLTGRPDHGDLTHHAQIVKYTGYAGGSSPSQIIAFEGAGGRFHHDKYSVYTKITETPSNTKGVYVAKPAFMLRKGDKIKVRQMVSGVPFTSDELTFSFKNETRVFIEETGASLAIDSDLEFLVETALPTKEGSFIFLEETTSQTHLRENQIAELFIAGGESEWHFNTTQHHGVVKPEQIVKWRPATVTSP